MNGVMTTYVNIQTPGMRRSHCGLAAVLCGGLGQGLVGKSLSASRSRGFEADIFLAGLFVGSKIQYMNARAVKCVFGRIFLLIRLRPVVQLASQAFMYFLLFGL